MSYLFNPANYDLSDPGSIPNLLIQHLTIVGIAMLISLLIAIPLGILAARYKWLYPPVISIAGVMYTIPALALIAFLVPVTGLTIATIIIPLILYAQYERPPALTARHASNGPSSDYSGGTCCYGHHYRHRLAGQPGGY